LIDVMPRHGRQFHTTIAVSIYFCFVLFLLLFFFYFNSCGFPSRLSSCRWHSGWSSGATGDPQVGWSLHESDSSHKQ